MAKYYVGREAITKLASLINTALKTKLGVNDVANGTKKLGNLNVSASNPTWGVQTGTGMVDISYSGGSIQIRSECPGTGQLSLLIDGLLYQREGNNRVLDVSDRRQAKVTLPVVSWDASKQQRITVSGVNVDETTQAIFATPSSANWKEYYESGIIGYVSAANTITFVCLGEKPKKDLVAYLYIGTLT